MSLSNTAERYGGISKTFHWLTALLILTLLPLGWYANQLPYSTEAELALKAWLFSLHKTLGVLAFFTALLRIIWAISQTKPGLLNADHKLESRAAEVVHWLLYGALVIVPLSGWIGHAAAQGFAPIWWPLGQNLPLVPKSTAIEHFASAVHWVSTKVLILSLLLHIAGALKHHVIDRDATLRRMLPGTPGLGPLPAQDHSRAPVLGAAAIWIAALGVAAALNAGEKGLVAETAIALEEVTSDWQVEDGTIEITVTQFGNQGIGTSPTGPLPSPLMKPSPKARWVTSAPQSPSLRSASVPSPLKPRARISLMPQTTQLPSSKVTSNPVRTDMWPRAP